MKTKVALIPLFGLDSGIRYISSYLNSKGYFTNIILFSQLRSSIESICRNYITAGLIHNKVCLKKDVELLINLLISLKPDLIGISLTSGLFTIASFLTHKIKERLNIPIVCGGIHPTICPEECIRIADIVCVGEGEYPMYELTQKLENKEEITGIKNLWIRKRDGSIEKNVLRDLILDLDSLPYPDFVDVGNKFLINNGKIIPDPIKRNYLKKVYEIVTSRGCYYGCSFCCNSALKIIYKDKGHFLRRRTPENVIDELVYVRKNVEILEIIFEDEILTYDHGWIEKFCQLYIKKVSLPFFCNAHPQYIDKEIIEMLARAGLIRMTIGTQTGSEGISREIFKRNQSNKEIIESGYTLKKLNITPDYEIMLDNSYDSDVDLDATVEFLLRLPRPYGASLFSLCYFPRTELTNRALKDKLITEEEVEGKSNKSLTNFLMVLDLAKDKKHLFWDLIMAMAISDFFSEKLIRRCKRSKFFRHHPKFLLILTRLYLRMSCISPVFIFDLFFKKHKKLNRSSILFRKAPRLFLRLIKLYLKISMFFKYKRETFMICNLITNYFEKETAPGFYEHTYIDKTRIDLLVFPKDSVSTVSKGLYLKIIQRPKDSPSLLPIKLLVCLCPLNIHALDQINERLACWEMNFNIDTSEVEIEIDLLLPRLFFVLKGIRREAPSIEGIKNTTKKGSYVVYFFLYTRSQKTYILKNCILIQPDDILNSNNENSILYPSMSHL